MAMDKDLNPMTTSADTRGMGMKAILGAQLRWAALVVAGLAASLTVSAGETFEYIHTDALGSPVAVTDANGAVIERMVYEPYGAVVGGPVKDGPGYTGHVADSATGLSYMQQRYMDPEIGAFLSVDPVTAHQQPVVQFSRYRYGNSNPYRFVDLDGREGWDGFQRGFQTGTLNAHYGEPGFPVEASLQEQAGYALGAALVKGGQSHGGVRVPAMRMAHPPVPSVKVGPATKVPGKSPSINPRDVAGKTPSEIDSVAKKNGLVSKGPDPSAGKGAYVDPANGNQRILVHPNASCGPHCHVNDSSGKRLDIDGNKVAPESPEAHLPLKVR